MASSVRAGDAQGDRDDLEWNPEWDDEDDEELDEEEQMMLKDAASSQYADPDLFTGDEKFFVNLTTTSNLMNLKGSLASILAAAGNTELYGDLIRKLEQAVPEEDREDFAALMIQRNYRRISQQRKARAERERRRMESVEKLQSVYRGHTARRFVRKRHLAAARIQGLGRGWMTRMRLFADKVLRNTKRIQRWFRACMARDLMTRMRRESGALNLQRVYRGHVGRLLFTFRKETLAATVVQRCVRGHGGRLSARVEIEKLAIARQKRMQRAALMFQGLYRGHRVRQFIAKRRAALNLARKIRMALRVQRAFRGYLGRVRFRVHLHLRQMDVYSLAITPIQALGRGHIVRQRNRDEAARLADLEAKRLAQALTLFGQTRAAKIIQKDYRRYTVKKYEWAINQFAAKIQLWYRLRNMGAQGRAMRQRVHKAATKLQFVVRGHQTRLFVREWRRKVYATRLQATFRGHVGRRRAEKRRRHLANVALAEERRRQAEKSAYERQMAIIAQSNRGMVEVFTQEPTRKDPAARPTQIVPGYMHTAALQGARVLRPSVVAGPDRTILDAPELGQFLEDDVHVQTGALRGHSDDFGWDSLDPMLDPYEAGGVDDSYYIAQPPDLSQTAPAGNGQMRRHGRDGDGTAASFAQGPSHARRNVTWGGRGGTSSAEDEEEVEEDDDGELQGAEAQEREQAWMLVEGTGERSQRREESEGEGGRGGARTRNKAKVRFGATQIAPSYLLPSAASGSMSGEHLVSASGTTGVAALGRDGRAIGLGSSLPAAAWKELRNAAGGPPRGGHGGWAAAPHTQHGLVPAFISAPTSSSSHAPPSVPDAVLVLADSASTSSGLAANTPYARPGDASSFHGTSGQREQLSPVTSAPRARVAEQHERHVNELLPSEVAHLQRLARLDAKLGYFRDAAGEWKQKESRGSGSVGGRKHGGAQDGRFGRPGEAADAARAIDLATVHVYGQDLVMSKSVRKRFRLDQAHAKALAPLAKSVQGGHLLPQLHTALSDTDADKILPSY